MATSRRSGGRVENEPAFVLHSHAYRETSLIVELLTREHGRVAVVARGAKRPRSALRSVLLAFQPLQVSWAGQGELRSLIGAEWLGGLAPPRGRALLCGFYMNELILRLLRRDDPHPALFDGYLRCLGRIGADASMLEPALRQFEWSLLREAGHAPDLRHDAHGSAIEASRCYRLGAEGGFEPVQADRSPTRADYSGAMLLALAEGRVEDAGSPAQAKQLTRAIISRELNGEPLHTRKLLLDLYRL
ncbi:MAG: DNA repair protein RecO [Burkholderiales bacterium]|nr:MAG: DNA repair protein RecO [Burkholderiales bacterium]